MADPTDPSSTIKDITNVASAATAADVAVNSLEGALRGMFDMLKDRSDVLGKITSSVGSLVLADTLYSSELYAKTLSGMEKAARVPRAIAAEIAGGNILAGTALNEQAKILFEDATRTQTELQTKMISFGFDATGQEIKRYAYTMYHDASELNKAYTESVLRESKLYSAGIKALNRDTAYDMKEATDLAMRGLGLDAVAVREIYEREYAHTGEITGKYIENFAATIMAGEKLTGLSKKALSEDVSRMLADFNMYGKMSEAQMIVLSKTVHDLGIDLATASESAQKFMSFEGATQAAADVAALTGVVIDAQKMFYLSNTDQASFITEQRKYLREMDFEHRDRVTQNAIAQSLGIKSTSDALAIINSQLDSSGKVAASTIASLASTDEYRGEALKEKERQAAAADLLKAMSPAEQAKAQKTLIDLAGGTEALGIAIETFNNRLIKTSAEVTPTLAAAGKEVSTAFSGGLTSASEIISKLQDGTEQFFKSGGFARIIDSVQSMLNGAENAIKNSKLYPKSVPPAWQEILNGIDLFKKEFDAKIDQIVKDLSGKLEQMALTVKEKGKFKAGLEVETVENSPIASPSRETGTTAQPPAVVVPLTAPVAVTPTVATPAATEVNPITATAETTDMKIKLHFEIDGDKMNNMIDLRIQELVTGQITFNNPVGGIYRPGTYRIRFEEANK
jgi:hypothetical protein